MRAVLLLLICSLLFSACIFGGNDGTAQAPSEPVQTTAEAPQTTEAQQTSEEESVPILTETAPEQESEAEEDETWREQYEALQKGLQEALIPSDVNTDDDFLAMSGVTLDGQDWSGADFADYDMTIIDCWMTWCGPCRDEMPTLEKYSRELPDNIRMMSVCFDGKAEPETCGSIVSQCGVTYPVILGEAVDGTPFDLSKYTQGVPTLLFINAQGQCFARFVGRPLTAEIAEKDAINIIVHLALEKMKGE